MHFDPVNMINSPDKYFNNGELIRKCFDRLDRLIKSCHGKDIVISQEFTTHLSEVGPGLGNLDYDRFLLELSKRPAVPLMLEHLSQAGEYRAALEYIKKTARKQNIEII